MTQDYKKESRKITRQEGRPLSADQVYSIWMANSIFGEHRTCSGPTDFGDKATVGKHLKRKGLNFEALKLEKDFAIYLGQHSGKWVVGIKNLLGSALIGGEEFNSLEELKDVWELD